MEASEFPEELQNLFNNLERNSNPWGMGAHTRAHWAEGLDLKIGEPAEYLFYVGCAGSFDDRNKKVSRATAKLLKEAGVDFSILGEMEMCNGDPARRAGNEFLFQMMAEMNVENMNSLGTLKVITACPHCFHTIGKEYEEYGGKYEVYHHSQILNDLKQKYNIIGDVRGRGLFLGIELIKDPENLTPASDEAEKIANDMKDHGILISTDGPDHNVLKIKPPMVFTCDNADQLVETLNKLLMKGDFN